MFEFAKKLMFAKQLNIEKGALTILNHRFMIVPAKTFATLVKYDIPDVNKSLYTAAKESGKLYADALTKKFGAKGQKLEGLMIDTFNLSGWGLLEILKNNFQKKVAVFHINNSSVAMEYGKSKKPICHTNRGFLAGGACMVHGSDVECLETKCSAAGNSFCEYVTGPINYLKDKYPDIVKTQIRS